jgi:hypothetical protein
MGNSLVILSNVSRREELINSRSFLNFFTTALTYIPDPDAIRLAEELNRFLLALATARAYLNQASIDFADYLWLYKES